jgi:pimeloyl-ACP methyl ester carboxylesterase
MPHSFSRTIVTTIAPLAFTLATGGGAESPPAGRETPFQKQTLALSTGITLAYVEAGDRAGEPVILLHGYTDTGRSVYPMMRHLLALRPDLRLIALDQRGHGASSMPPAEACRAAPERCFGPGDLAADVRALMEQKWIRRASVVGHSMGSLVAQELALTRPERVRRLVLIGSFARTVDHPVTPLAADSGAEAWMLPDWVTEPLADSAFLAAIAPETARTRLGTWIGVARALLAVDHTERLKGVRVPTLAIWAAQGAFFPESPDQEVVRAAGGGVG